MSMQKFTNATVIGTTDRRAGIVVRDLAALLTLAARQP
jgi:hypothetical protein